MYTVCFFACHKEIHDILDQEHVLKHIFKITAFFLISDTISIVSIKYTEQFNNFI